MVSRLLHKIPFIPFMTLLPAFFLSVAYMILAGPNVESQNGEKTLKVDRSIVFEVYAGNFVSRAEYPYEMLLVRADGLVYYETGEHLDQTKIQMRQGQITAEQVMQLKNLINDCPSDIQSQFGSQDVFFMGPYILLFSPGREIWQHEERDKRISANFDPFTQNITGFYDVPAQARGLWAELQSLVNSTVPTDVHPDLWPDKYFDPRNYSPPPEPLMPV